MQARECAAMTQARKKALQWFYDRGEVHAAGSMWLFEPTINIIGRMVRDGQLQKQEISPWAAVYKLTDKGRRMLHGDSA